MFKNKKLAAGLALVVILTSISLAGCSSDVSQNPSSSSGQQPSASPEQKSINQSTQQQQPSSSDQQPSGSPSQQPPAAPNMTTVLNRAAEILGVPADEFTAAFQNAMPSPQSGREGQPSAPPSGQQGQPPAPPSGQEQGQQPPAPPSGQQPSESGPPQFMTDIYAKMAAELNISADDIAKAMTQAQKELQE